MFLRAFIKNKLNPFPKELGENPIFIFKNIPKCGGTSFNVILRTWFYLIKDYSPDDIQFPDKNNLSIELDNFERSVPRLNKVKPWKILAGHYHHPRFSLSKRFPGIYEN